MPELPEVETIRRELAPFIVGRRIKTLSIDWPPVVRHKPGQELHQYIQDKSITRLRRRGKYLIFELEDKGLLVFHMGMTGSLILGKAASEPPQYTRARLILDNGNQVFFRDPRKFGHLMLLGDIEELEARLGPEPLEDDFTPSLLATLLSHRRAPIKAVLTDQHLIAGLGNMYADESLFLAGIHPSRPANSLLPAEVDSLHSAIRRTLQESIKHKGATVSTYLRPDGKPGQAQEGFHVAHRKGEPCPRCGGSIQRLSIRDRGSYFCPHCQL